MKVIIGNYELTITGKRTTDSKNNEDAVMNFLNELSCVYGDASTFNKCQGYAGIAKDYSNKDHQIYIFLDRKGLYNS